MLFSLEALNATEGDCLLLHHGTAAQRSLVLIDGGPRATYQATLKKRLLALRNELGLNKTEPLPIDLVVVTHIDNDHICGILELASDLVDLKEKRQPLPFSIQTLWHNSFARAVKSASPADYMPALRDLDDAQASPAYAAALEGFVASVKESQQLYNAAEQLGFELNTPFDGLVMMPATGPEVIEIGTEILYQDEDTPESALLFTVVGPTEARIEAYRDEWKKKMPKTKKALAGQGASIKPDTSAFNLSSIAMLAEMDDKTMLLTGDALSDDLIDGLEAAGRLPDNGDPLHVDILKVAHHGSNRNSSKQFFERVTADHYIFSANGKHDNPDVDTLKWLAEARGDASYTLYFTFPEAAYEDPTVTGGNAKIKAALQKVDEWLRTEKPDNVSVVYRDPSQLGLVIDLGDETISGG